MLQELLRYIMMTLAMRPPPLVAPAPLEPAPSTNAVKQVLASTRPCRSGISLCTHAQLWPPWLCASPKMLSWAGFARLLLHCLQLVLAVRRIYKSSPGIFVGTRHGSVGFPEAV